MKQELHEQVVLRTATNLLIPFIVVFGVYVIAHGEHGAGGGFQGGVILASAFILHALVFGLKATRRIVPRGLTDALAPLGVLIYAGTGAVTLLLGGRFLEYARLRPDDPVMGHPLGMTLVETGVGITVAAVMVTIFAEIADPGDEAPRPGEGRP